MVHGSSDIEHLLQALLPLLNQFGRCKYQQSLDSPICQQWPQNQTSFDRLPHADIVRNEQSYRPGLERTVTDPKLVRQEGYARPREDAPGIVYRPDGGGLNT